MNSTLVLSRLALAAALIGATTVAAAQAGATPAKKELVQKILKLNQGGIEAVGTQLAGQTANQAMQAAGQAVGRLPADKRDAVATQVQADVRKFYDETAPLLRERAVKLGPATLGAALEEKFSEDELKTLLAWLESPVSRKYQQMAGDQQQALAQKLIEDTRAQIEPKLKALDQTISTRLSAATGASKAAPAPKK
ncbi:MAG: DUF2059 domain-containing protein [Burkholderiaceae bacterium]|jgi:uncharacterized protein|nr:DUF2059 domain-containing protein [Burkholderiaceae bacterium]